MSRTAAFLLVWCVIAGLIIAIATAHFWPTLTMLFDPASSGHSFRVASDAMMPALQRGDVVRPVRVAAADLQRGDVIAFATPDVVRIDRIVGLPGDTVALADGHVVINGRQAVLSAARRGPVIDAQRTMVADEALPGERGRHAVLDTGRTAMDNMAPITLPAGRLFVLGDDRDMAADSRLSNSEGGVGTIAAGSVIGRIDGVLWDNHGGVSGRSIKSGTGR